MASKKKIAGMISFVLFLMLLPIGVKHAAVYYLTKAGAENVTIDDIDLNLFTGILKIEKFSIKSEQFEPLSLSSAMINISMLRLFTGKILIERSTIDGLDLTVENTIADIVIGFPVFSKLSPEDQKEIESEGKEDDFPFGIRTILFSNSIIKYKDETAVSIVDINTIRLFDFYFWEKNTPAVLKIDARVNTAKLEADVVMKPFAQIKTIDSHIRLDQLQLGSFSGYLTDYVTGFQTIVTTDVKVSATIDQSNKIEVEQSGGLTITGIKGEIPGLPVPVTIVNAAFSYDGSTRLNLASGQKFPVLNLDGTIENNDLNVMVDSDKIEVNHDGLSWIGSIKNTTGIAEETEITGNVVLDNFFLNGEGNDNHLFSLDKLSLNTINVAGINKVGIASVILSGLGVATPVIKEESNEQKSLMPIVTETISINKVQLADINTLNVDTIEIENVIVPVKRNTNGTLPVAEMTKKFTGNLYAILKKMKTNKEKNEETEVNETPKEQIAEPPPVETSKSRFIVEIGSLSLNGENTVQVRDSTVKPAYNKAISIEKFTLADISNVNLEDKATLDALIKTEKHGFIDIKGDVQLFNPKVTLHMKGTVKGVHLAELSPYTASAVGYNIQTGVFNTKVDCKVAADKLDVKNDMFVENIILIPNANGAANKFAKKFLMPVDQTLSVLRDDNNNITLSIPVTGDIKNPDFHYQDVMKLAMQKAVKSASISILKNLIQPYGVVITATQYALAGKEYLEKIRLDSVQFRPGSPVIETAGRDYLDTIVKLLNTKKELRLSACGFSTRSDIQGGDPVKHQEPFVELSKQRQSNIIHYLESKGISHKRLFYCNGDVDVDEKAIARVELSL